MVVDEHEKLLGILTDKDCLRVLSHAIYDNQEHPATVADFMSEATIIEPEMDFFRVVEQFLRCHFPTLPVVKEGVLMGRISRKDVLQGIQHFLTTKAEELRKMLQPSEGSERPSSIEEMQKAAAQHDRESLARRFTQNR
jgi:Mg/Co/Ni transporter MgtE